MRVSKMSYIAVAVWIGIFVLGSFIDAHAGQRSMNMKTSANCSNYINIAAVMAEKDSRVESVSHNVNTSVMVYYHDRTYISMRCSGPTMYTEKGSR